MLRASQMDPKTQATSLHGVSMLDAAQNRMEAHLLLALLREAASENDRALINATLAAEVNLYGRPELAVVEAAREDGNAPNLVLAAAASRCRPDHPWCRSGWGTNRRTWCRRPYDLAARHGR